jgi:hypothetical protein
MRTGKPMAGSPLRNLYHTQPASAKLGQFGVITQTRNVNIIIQGCLENIRTLRRYNRLIVNYKMDEFLHLIAMKLHFS